MNLDYYKSQATNNAPDVTPTEAAHNLIDIGLSVARMPAGETGNLNAERDEIVAILGAALFNAAVIADRYNISLEDCAYLQLNRLRTVSDSGRLRRLAQQGRIA